MSNLSESQIAALKGARRRTRAVATMLENSRIGWTIMSERGDINARAFLPMLPTLAKQSRTFGDQCDAILKAGHCSNEQWKAIHFAIQSIASAMNAFKSEWGKKS
jgi:hypothetical protein